MGKDSLFSRPQSWLGPAGPLENRSYLARSTGQVTAVTTRSKHKNNKFNPARRYVQHAFAQHVGPCFFFISMNGKCFHSQNGACIIPFSCSYLFMTKLCSESGFLGRTRDGKEFHARQVARPQPLENSNYLPQYSS
jgi:hypothetical protein